MTIAHFLLLDAPDDSSATPASDFLSSELSALAATNGVERVDRYEPVEFNHEMNDDHGRLLVMIQTFYTDVASMEQTLVSDTFRSLLSAACDDTGYVASHDALEAKVYPVEGDDIPAEWTAPISFVVRYHHPAENLEEFVSFYVANHPVIEKRFPDIRNIMCYIPVGWNDPTGLPRQDYMLGNEVVFDSVEALHTALTSDVMEDMMKDFANFPPFSGNNTHFAMHRTRINQ